MTYFFLGVIAGFVVGAFVVLGAWDAAAKRGGFEIGGKIYRVEEIALPKQLPARSLPEVK